MIASTSHDMRTPLNAITNMIELVQKKTSDIGTMKLLKVANCSANLLLSLVNDTLDYYQIKSGKFSLRKESFKVRDIVDSCFDLVSL